MRIPVSLQRASLLVAIVVFSAIAKGQSPAGAGESSSSRSKSKSAVHVASPDPGTVADGVYRNRFFGFAYKLPYGWVDRTDRMQDDSEPGKSRVLLAAFEHPPEASTESINSAVVIATESVDSYPGIQSAVQYFGPLTELTTSKGFTVINGPHDTEIGTTTLARADFKREIGSLTMYQSSLVILARGHIASFTFIGDSQENVEKLVSSLTFGSQVAPSGKHP
jgi:hypothetical protein